MLFRDFAKRIDDATVLVARPPTFTSYDGAGEGKQTWLMANLIFSMRIGSEYDVVASSFSSLISSPISVQSDSVGAKLVLALITDRETHYAIARENQVQRRRPDPGDHL